MKTDNRNFNIRHPRNDLYLSVGPFRNLISSETPFTWTLFEESNQIVRIKSEKDNLFLKNEIDQKLNAFDVSAMKNSVSMTAF